VGIVRDGATEGGVTEDKPSEDGIIEDGMADNGNIGDEVADVGIAVIDRAEGARWNGRDKGKSNASSTGWPGCDRFGI
jgi:hypothetical protein